MASTGRVGWELRLGHGLLPLAITPLSRSNTPSLRVANRPSKQQHEHQHSCGEADIDPEQAHPHLAFGWPALPSQAPCQRVLVCNRLQSFPRADVSGLGDRLAASGALLHFNDGIDRLAYVRPVVWMSRAASLYDLVGG